MHGVSGPYQIATVLDSTLNIFKEEIELTISIDRTIRASGLKISPNEDAAKTYTSKNLSFN